MRTSLRVATVLASTVIVCAGTLSAFAQSGASGTSVVVLDVAKVFKEHIRFKQQMDVIKKDVEKFEGKLRDDRARLQQMAEELRTYKSGSPEYKNLEAKMAKMTSDLQVETQLKRKEFMEREARLYYNTYTEVTRAVEAFAKQYGIQLVLKFNSEPIKPDDRNSVLAGVNATIVYQDHRDITARIVTELNRGSIQRNDHEHLATPPNIPRPTRN